MAFATAIHHIEVCVANLESATEIFTSKFDFRVAGKRSTNLCEQKVLQAGNEFFVITQRKKQDKESANYHCEDWTTFCCHERDEHTVDSAFNVALLVKDVYSVTERAKDNGGIVIRPPKSLTIGNTPGRITYSVISSPCGDVIHTLISKDEGCCEWFLPGFEPVASKTPTSIWERYPEQIGYIDHVTYALQNGQSSKVLDWYENVFGMTRFLVNKHEDHQDGLILESPVWMRLKAMEYWLCSETALKVEDGQLSEEKSPTKNGRRPQLVIVLAESAFDKSSNHLEDYLRDHEGPGVQHIAFSTPNIFGTIAELMNKGAQFRQPPELYYQEIDRLSSIKDCGYDVDSLKRYGILLDTEADLEDIMHSPNKDTVEKRHLMQIFTTGLFHHNTLFLEVIQRCGARGFGAGNISALARCIEEQKKQEAGKEECIF